MQLVNEKISFARVLVKLAVIKRSKLLEDFQASWQLAATKGVVKKVVDVRNRAFGDSAEEDDFMSASLASEDLGEFTTPVLSPTSQMEVLDEDDEDDEKTSPTRPRRETDPPETETDQEVESGSEKVNSNRMHVPIAVASSPAPSMLSPTSEMLLRDGDDSMVSDADTVPSKLGTSTSAFIKQDKVVARKLEPKLTPTKPASRPASKATLLACSKATISSSTPSLASITATIDISGSVATDDIIAAALAMRATERLDARCRVTNINITDAPLTALSLSVCNVFSESKEMKKSKKNGEKDDSGVSEVDRLRGLMLDDQLRHLSINACPSLLIVDVSINRFSHLVSLDLSHNGIVSMEEGLHLPLLHRLDISYNNISSLQFCTDLPSLSSLTAKSNAITSIRAIQVLVPLAKTLTSINLAINPVCSDTRYPATVLNILPKLRTFDTKSLSSLGQSYSRPSTPTRRSDSSVPPLPQDLSTLNAQLEEMEVDASLDVEFERRLQLAIRRKNGRSPPGNLAISLSESDGDSDRESPPSRPKRSASASRAERSSSMNRSSSRSVGEARETPSRRSQAPPRSQSRPSQSTANTSNNLTSSSHTVGADALPSTSSLLDYTSTSKSKRLSQRQGRVSHWSGHENDAPLETPREKNTHNETLNNSGSNIHSKSDLSNSGMRDSVGRESTLLQETRAHILRKKSFGIAPTKSSLDDSGLLSKTALSARAQHAPPSQTLRQRAEDERYGIWHPRYRVPMKTFGFSKPFLTRSLDDSQVDIPLFDKYVRRMRDGFEKLPTRGTFDRASKGLLPGWYPMDYDEVEAIRRQGYFHDVIGDTQKYSYRDVRSNESASSHPALGVSINKGSVILTPRKGGRRGSNAMHESRQFKTLEGTRDTNPADEYSDYRKWNPQLWSKYGNNDNATYFEPGIAVEGLAGQESPRKVGLSVTLEGSQRESSLVGSAGGSVSGDSWKGGEKHERPLSQSWQGMLTQQQAQQQEAREREEKQLSAYLAWLEGAEGNKGGAGK